MNDKVVRAYLWYDIIRLAFQPSGDAQQRNWIRLYIASLKDFWELGDSPDHPTCDRNVIKGMFFCPNMLVDYSVSTREKYTVSLFHTCQTNQLLWVHDVDRGYFHFPTRIFVPLNKRKAIVKKVFEEKGSDDHIKLVIDGLICHPRVHQHIESPIDNHYIRIGGGIDNPYLFLFHLRYQLCPIEHKRQAEKSRLLDLFRNAIKTNKPVPASELMRLPSEIRGT